MMAVRKVAFSAMALAACWSCLSAPANALPAHAPRPSTDIVRIQAAPNVNTQAQIYLLRGLANVFSRGMDAIGARLRTYGFSPHVINHRGWQEATDRIARNYRSGQTAPIVLIGHSLGANAVFRMAQRLKTKGIPVAYLATFDPTRASSVPSNVRFFANFYQNNGQGRRASFAPSRGDEKTNLNLTSSPGLTHTSIDQNERLQNIVIGRILEVTAR
jgi:hypothetical protein